MLPFPLRENFPIPQAFSTWKSYNSWPSSRYNKIYNAKGANLRSMAVLNFYLTTCVAEPADPLIIVLLSLLCCVCNPKKYPTSFKGCTIWGCGWQPLSLL